MMNKQNIKDDFKSGAKGIYQQSIYEARRLIKDKELQLDGWCSIPRKAFESPFFVNLHSYGKQSTSSYPIRTVVLLSSEAVKRQLNVIWRRS